MKKIVTVVGARPQFIKVGPVSRAMALHPDLEEMIVHTGQHFDDNMSKVFFQQLDLPEPAVNLAVHGGSHAEQTSGMLTGLEKLMNKEAPDLVLVYGDTNSTLAAALAAAKLSIPVAHIEAGLRSFNREMPEEINRILTDHIAALHFTPSAVATGHLKREGIAGDGVCEAGDVMFDAILHSRSLADDHDNVLETFELTPGSYAMLTMHRAENTDSDDRLNYLLEQIFAVAAEVDVIFPLHPRTRQAFERINRLDEVAQKLKLVDPLGYLDTTQLLTHANVLLTDSGGMQKEAMFLETPCITLRNETEWVETIESGANILFNDPDVALVELWQQHNRESPAFNASPYGSGNAASIICEQLAGYLR